VLEAPLETTPGAVLELGGGEGLEERDGGPAVLGGTREQIIQVVGDPREAETSQLVTQGRGGGRD